MRLSPFYLAGCLLVIALAGRTFGQWKPASGPLTTRWTKTVTPASAHREYPRPQMTRDKWTNLNGLWQYAIRPKNDPRPEKFAGEILVPFPVESALSGVMKPVGEANRLWYRRTFQPPKLDGGRLLLHFGAVDWLATVWINGRRVGAHRGGYDPFSLDITDALGDGNQQEIVVSVWDPTDKGYQPRGKQVARPGGIWYTSVTGIWQTVWLEPVPAAHVRSLHIVPDIDKSEVSMVVRCSASPGERRQLIVKVTRLGKPVATAASEFDDLPPDGVSVTAKIPREQLALWSPDDPALYDLEVTLLEGDRPVDRVNSYFGMRKIALGKDDAGHTRLLLNNKPLFHFGPLDQGWWPDGLYTAPTDEALKYDVEVTKRLGFNMCRKHVKVEPARWYYWCDRLGLMVWQDMPNGDRHIAPGAADIRRSPESAENYRREWKAIIDRHVNHPSIVVWVPFNEGWGQFDTDQVLAWTKRHDPTRLVDGPSGWTDRGTGDMHDIHSYPGPAMPKLETKRAAVLGEFGGLGLPLEKHLWWNKRNWGYRTYKTRDELQSNYRTLIARLRPLYAAGLAAAVYTQTTDVEGEVNGLITYDRAELKFDARQLSALHRKFYQPPPIIIRRTIVPTSEETAQTWRYTTDKPADGWQAAGFDEASWTSGKGGFGERTTPGSVVRTDWKTKDIWLRRTFDWDGKQPLEDPHLRIHHDEDAEVYLNGRRVTSLSGYVTGYVELPLEKAGREALRRGNNTLAVHCRQTLGGQYIDVGLVDVIEKPRPGK